ncbi:hypothetical protein [Sphingomonas sp.]|uniref:hypothetical protein n=1 Tax=Sphingomonas sp. TaxID=28214 RepID=UPI0025D18661|nr:hypothetical protein [Sphingomonas sp.]
MRDLRGFIAKRRPQELLFALPALVLTLLVLVGFYKDSRVETPPKGPDIIYVQSWPLSRTDAEIKAQQKIDQIEKEKRLAEIKRQQDERKAEFKKYDDWLTNHGF